MGEEPVPMLTEVLEDVRSSKIARANAVKNLGKIGARQDLILKALNDDDWEVREAAVTSLGWRKYPKAVSALIDLFTNEKSLKVKHAIVWTLLALVPDDSESASLIRFFSARLRDKTFQQFRDSIIRHLGELGDQRALSALRGMARTKSQSPYTLENIIDAMGKIGGSEEISFLVSLLESDADIDPFFPITALALIGSRMAPRYRNRVIYELKLILDSGHMDKVKIVPEALETIGGEKLLINLMGEKSRDIDTDKRIIFLLGHPKRGSTRSNETKDFLHRVANGELIHWGEQNGVIRETAISGLQALGCKSDKTLKVIKTALRDRNRGIKIAALKLCKQVKNPSVVPRLIMALKDADTGVRIEAAEALGFQNDRRVVRPFLRAIGRHEDFRVREKAIHWLAKLRLEGAEREKLGKNLVKVLSDDQDHLVVRKEAAWTLGVLKYTKAAGTLKKVIDNKEEKKTVRIASAAALLSLGDDSGVGMLLAYLRETDKKETQQVWVARVLAEAYPKDAEKRARLRNKFTQIYPEVEELWTKYGKPVSVLKNTLRKLSKKG